MTRFCPWLADTFSGGLPVPLLCPCGTTGSEKNESLHETEIKTAADMTATEAIRRFIIIPCILP
jgi:hypothetical protein